MTAKYRLLALVVTSCLWSSAISADQREELLTLRNTMIGMIESLVAKGSLSEEDARAMIERAEAEARQELEQIVSDETPAPDAVRVGYVPDIVKDQLRAEIKQDLREEVTEDILQQAQADSWGVPGALPAWIGDIRWTADFRIRGRTELYDDGNELNFYRNFQAINAAGGVDLAGEDALTNVSEDRERIQARVRFGMDVEISPHWYAGLRLTTTNAGNPVSRNVTFAQGESGDFEPILDLAYIHYKSKYLLFSGGRIRNPFAHTDLVWDPDLTFEGLSFTGLYPFELLGNNSRLFLTAGAFPLEEVELADQDKWLYSGQLGVQFGFGNGGRLLLASSYHDFENVAGERNQPLSRLLDYTAPSFLQKGNTLFDIRNDDDPATGLFALASDYKLLDHLLMVDSGPLLQAGERPLHLRFSANYVKNIGWDSEEIFERTGLQGIEKKNEGYQFRLEFGRPVIARAGDWRFAALFKHLERDAVLDAFTDSAFHAGGTDAEGWGLEVSLALSRNVWIELDYQTANEIDGPPLGVDLVQLDLNARF